MVKKQKRQTRKSQNIIVIWLKKFWWIVAIAVVVIAIPIFMSVKSSLDARTTQERFEGAYEQMLTLYGSMNEPSLVQPKASSISKECRKLYFGFTKYIECGTYTTFYSVARDSSEVRNNLQARLTQMGFESVDVRIGTDINDGTASFATSLGLKCGVDWVYENVLDSQSNVFRFSGYCRDYAPQFLDGYDVIE